jgi:hypothetical protein
MVSQQLIEELKIIIKEDYGKDLEIKEVAQIANNLVGYFSLLAQIHQREGEPENKYDNNETANK